MSKPSMLTATQARHWSRHATDYDELFLNPFHPDVINPLLKWLDHVEDAARKTVIDLGCGTGPLLPRLIDRFERVIALDFASGMIREAKARLGPEADRVEFLQCPMADVAKLEGQIDLAIAVNSLVMPDPRVIDTTLRAISSSLTDGGVFLGVVPAIDAIQYQTMLLHDRALTTSGELSEADQVAANQAEHHLYDFAFGRFQFRGLRQNFWHWFEIEHRFRKAGFQSIQLDRVLYPWDENLPGGKAFLDFPRSWDWAFEARKSHEGH